MWKVMKTPSLVLPALIAGDIIWGVFCWYRWSQVVRLAESIEEWELLRKTPDYIYWWNALNFAFCTLAILILAWMAYIASWTWHEFNEPTRRSK